MFNISCYALHPIIKRFITLWRYAQAVSDCLTFALSVLCCQCWEMMPMSAASGEQASIEAFKIVPVVDAGRSTGEPLKAQHLVLDFTPKAEDNEEVQRRCLGLWDLAQQTHLERTTVQTTKQECTSQETSVEIEDNEASGDSEFPAIHTLHTLTKKDALKAAFATKIPST